ncbi:MAG: radical SAM protein [Clostridia bacterium]|nr:radical SAM protein [Clostridia bacterium]
MSQSFNLQEHIARGVEKIVADTLKATLRDPRESAFMVRFAAAASKATKRRLGLEKEGLHVPSFLIASITSACNLHCAGCYSRCNEATVDTEPVKQLSTEEWGAIFREAESLGVSFIMLAGGEPLLRWDVIEAAGRMKNILFPIFTNGTYMDDTTFAQLDKCRNLIPVLSIEGGREITDARRGEGVYDKLIAAMDRLHGKDLLFGASITVTTENIKEVTSPAFMEKLVSRGCKLVIYIEFVPVTEEARHLAPTDAERAYLLTAMQELRETYPELVALAFPGDEKADGGCMAAGRGFFHINSHGGAEPCPFSPYSDVNVRDLGVRGALKSPLFMALREGGILDNDHVGGCVLYEQRERVEALLS